MRTYEILLILPAEADDAVVGGITDRVTGVIGGSGGEISKVDRWGIRLGSAMTILMVTFPGGLGLRCGRRTWSRAR